MSARDSTRTKIPTVCCDGLFGTWVPSARQMSDARMTPQQEDRGWPMLLAANGYLVVTGLLFLSLCVVLPPHLFAAIEDPLLNTSILAWNAKRLPLSNDWWDFPAFAPL